MTPTPAPKSPVPAPAPTPLLLTIRFSASLPDLELDIPRPGATTVVSLKHLIRSRLDKAHAARRLRFIHGGKILPDTAVLSSVLRAPPAPPPPPPNSRYTHNHNYNYNQYTTSLGLGTDNNGHSTTEQRRGGKGKGKGEDEDLEGRGGGGGGSKSKAKGKSIPGRPEPSPRIYVNCSIGDELSPSELESEARAASLPPPTSSTTSPLHPSRPGSGLSLTTNGLANGGGGGGGDGGTNGGGGGATTTTPAPRGFDRLLSAGFTPSEVNQLRLQFRSIHSSRYTPDTLPSPDSFRRMEDAWIDDNGASIPDSTGINGSGGGGDMLGIGGGAGAGGGTDTDDVGLVGMVDVLVRGVITGFVWPLGSAGWMMREGGMASDRWRFMVMLGVMLGVLIGFIRAISGDK